MGGEGEGEEEEEEVEKEEEWQYRGKVTKLICFCSSQFSDFIYIHIYLKENPVKNYNHLSFFYKYSFFVH